MRAITYNSYGDIDKLQITELNSPKPGINDVIVKVIAISPNPVDLKKLEGGFKIITNVKKFPFIIGCDFSGEIIEIGKNVGAFKVGDKVFGMTEILFGGSGAEEIKVSQKYISLAPKNLELNYAAALPQVSNTCLLALRNIAKLRAGHKLLINGASGGVGSTALQIAKLYEADCVAITSNRNIDWIKSEFNPSKVIDYTKEDFTETDEKYDVVFDANGNRSYPEVEKILTANGMYVTTKNNVYTQIDSIKQFTKRKKARVVLSGKTSTSNLDLIRMWVEDGKLKPYIEKTFSLTEFKDAYQHLAKGRTRGKLVINME